MKDRVSKGFDLLSGFYDLMLWSTSGNAILKSQTALLSCLPEIKTVLILGGGTGSFLVELLNRKNIESVTYADISAGMIKKTQNKIQKRIPEQLSKVKFICGEIDSIHHEENFDLVITNYFLDQFETEELGLLLDKIAGHLIHSGYWYVADFSFSQKPSFIKKIIHQILYLFFRTICNITAKNVPDLKTEMKEIKLKLKAERYFLKGLLWCGVYSK